MGQDTREEGGGEWARTPERRVVVNGSGHQREEGGGEWGRTPERRVVVNGAGW